MENVNCNLCKSNNAKLLYFVDPFNIVKCLHCGLVYVNPRLSCDELKEIYNSKNYYDFSYPKYESKKKFIKWESRKILKEIRRLGIKKSGKILDIGCSFGFFLDCARELDWETYGIELSQCASDFARDQLHLNVTTGSMENVSYSNDYFDAITMWDVLEHLRDPFSSLKKLHGLLKTGGIIAIATPNFDSPLAKITKVNWEQIKPKYHLYYFSVKTIVEILQKSGMTIMKLSTNGLGGTFKLLLGKSGSGGDAVVSDCSRVKFYVKNVVNKFSEIFRIGEKLVVYSKKIE